MNEVVRLRAVDPEQKLPDLRSVPALLRRIADQLEAGAHGIKDWQDAHPKEADSVIVRGALVLRISGQQPHIFGLGDTTGERTYMDLHAGAQELMSYRHMERS